MTFTSRKQTGESEGNAVKVVLIGHVCVDTNTSENSSYTSWGSPLMYAAQYFRNQLGIKAVLVAPYGRDFQQFTRDLKVLPAARGVHTLAYKNHVKNDYRIQECEYADLAEPPALTVEIKRYIARADIVCVAPLLPNFPVNYVRGVLSLRKPESIAVLLPQGYFRKVDSGGRILHREFEEADEMIPLFDMVSLSEADHPRSFDVTRRWAETAASTCIIMTQGSRGASWITAGGTITELTKPVPENRIVDSVGCGDTFSAAAMYSYLCHRDVALAMKAGNKAARAKLFQAASATEIWH